ncbi:MAG: hypothetical protein QGI58_05860 [Candidatus Thalassarchaeaceae archaeon]|jgi:hypothetical protein|nr:hypothetical protein [Candidatus Thalassarchaeaceae archaeon]
MAKDPLDEYFDSVSARVHSSPRKLAKVVRAAYPIGVPALIMKSSTDRFGEAAGYSFHLGTPDEFLRRITSWLLTNAGSDQGALLKLVPRLWKRHGREDVALAALLIANLDHRRLGSDPWGILASNISRKEPAEALLLTIEEVLRAGRPLPSDETLLAWCSGRTIDGHLALMVLHAATVRGERVSSDVAQAVQSVSVPPGDSLLGRIKARVVAG